MEPQGRRGSALDCGIKEPYGAVFTVFYNNFQRISEYDEQAIFDEIKCLNIPSNSISKQRNVIAANSEGKDKTLDQIHMEIASLAFFISPYLLIWYLTILFSSFCSDAQLDPETKTRGEYPHWNLLSDAKSVVSFQEVWRSQRKSDDPLYISR